MSRKTSVDRGDPAAGERPIHDPALELVEEPDAVVEQADRVELAQADLEPVDDGARARPGGGLSVLGGVTHTDRDAFDRTLSSLRALDARRVLSSHLPPAAGMADQLIGNLSRVPGSTPWVGPDQAALDQLLASVTG